MKEITYVNMDDYLEKARTFSDPKIVKVYERGGEANRKMWVMGKRIFPPGRAVTFMRTWLIQWWNSEALSDDMVTKLKATGHCEGRMEDIAPMGRMLG